MNTKLSNKLQRTILWDLLLYSCMGCISFLLLVHYTDIPLRQQSRLISPQGILGAIIFFNGMALTMRYVQRKVSDAYPIFLKQRYGILIFLSITAVALLTSNYLLLSGTKIVIGATYPFRISTGGIIWLTGIWLVELLIVSLFMTNKFYKNLLQLYKHSQELEENNLRAQYIALQNQLNPHFLFNSLNTLISEIEYDPQNAIQFTRHLADTYRYILLCQDKQVVSLEEELDFVKIYTTIQNVRLGNCIHLDISIQPEMMKGKLPPLTLQLLIENVIKHNTISFSKPITITIRQESIEGNPILSISNPIAPKKGVVSSGKGLNNLRMRYQLLSNNTILIENNQQTFTVKVPILYE